MEILPKRGKLVPKQTNILVSVYCFTFEKCSSCGSFFRDAWTKLKKSFVVSPVWKTQRGSSPVLLCPSPPPVSDGEEKEGEIEPHLT